MPPKGTYKKKSAVVARKESFSSKSVKPLVKPTAKPIFSTDDSDDNEDSDDNKDDSQSLNKKLLTAKEGGGFIPTNE